ncbi:MAG: hypothetical protein ACLSHL_10300 [Alistipes communis]
MFAEQGVVMLSSVLRTPIAMQVCISVVKAFVAMRTYLTTTSPETLAARLESIDRRLLELEQTRIAGELGPVREHPLPERLSDEAILVDYSLSGPLSFSPTTDWIGGCSSGSGARYNGWLIWNGELGSCGLGLSQVLHSKTR